MKSAIEKALDKISSKNVNVQKMEEPKPPKKLKDGEIPVANFKPSLYLDDKELPTIPKYKAGDKIILVIECTVKGTSAYDRLEGKETRKTFNADLEIDAIADITKG